MCSTLFSFILTLLTKTRNVEKYFIYILGSCYTTLDAKLLEDAATLLPGYIGTYLQSLYIGSINMTWQGCQAGVNAK